MRLLIALPLALLGGWLLDLASPGVSFWPASLLGVGFILAALWRQRARRGFALGAVAGAAFWLPHLSWLTLYLGPVPWLGLCALMICWFAFFGLSLGVATRILPNVFLQALAAAGLWVLREQIQGALPYGGFPWGRLAHMQAEGPLSHSVSWLGFAGLAGVLVFAIALPIAAVSAVRKPVSARYPETSARSHWRVTTAALAGSTVAIVLLATVPVATLQQTGTLRVAAVQGNSKSGIFDDRESGDVLQDHVSATEELLDRLELKGEFVDVIVWPENSAEFDLPSNSIAQHRIEALSLRADAPIVVGTIVADDGAYTNSSLVWAADGQLEGRYDKRYPVPFAEYMPHRSFYRMFAPELVDLVQLEYAAGERDAVLPVETRQGAVRAGIAICFDIIFDAQASLMVSGDAQVIFAQTNNADFGRTDESAQQLAIARMRAMETGRAVVNISTVGTSAIIAPDGSDLDRLETFSADAMVAEVPLVEGSTPASRFGAAIAALWIASGVGALAASFFLRHRKQPREARSGAASLTQNS